MLLNKYLISGLISGFLLYAGYKINVVVPPGYCRNQDKYISDEEFIQIAIDLREKDWAERGGREKFVYGVDFDSKDPNCCLVDREKTSWEFTEGKVTAVFWRLFDYQEVSVKLNNETSINSIKEHTRSDKFVFDACGELKDRIWYNWDGR